MYVYMNLQIYIQVFYKIYFFKFQGIQIYQLLRFISNFNFIIKQVISSIISLSLIPKFIIIIKVVLIIITFIKQEFLKTGTSSPVGNSYAYSVYYY